MNSVCFPYLQIGKTNRIEYRSVLKWDLFLCWHVSLSSVETYIYIYIYIYIFVICIYIYIYIYIFVFFSTVGTCNLCLSSVETEDKDKVCQ